MPLSSTKSVSKDSQLEWPNENRAVGKSLDVTVQNNSKLELPLTETDIRSIVQAITSDHNIKEGSIEMVYVTPDEIVRINSEYLGHDYVTDNIAFQVEDEGDPLEATIFQCPQRIEEQSKEFNSTYPSEFVRVLTHGILHICGYRDSSKEEKAQMTAKEDEYLLKFGF